MASNDLTKTRAVLWDMDGVLVDSAEYHFLAWQEALRTLEQHEITYAQFQHSFGQRNDTVLRGFFGAGYSVENIARVADHKEATYRRMVAERGIQPLPGVMKWLNHLREAGWQQAVASAAPRANVDAIVDALGIRNFFGALTSSEDVTRGKPDPQVYLLAAERVGATTANSIVIEDAPAGTEGARRAGMACIGVLSSHGALQADVIVRTLDELHEGVFDELIQHLRTSDT